MCLVWLWLVPEAGGMREPFAPTSGVSAWPSQLLRTLAVVLFAWFLDYAWGRSATAAHRIGNDYFPAQSSQPADPLAMPLSRRMVDAIALLHAWWQDRVRQVRSNWRGFAGERLERMATGLAEDSIWFWRPQVVRDGTVDGALVWREYRRLLRNGPRLWRLLIWLAVAFIFLSVESYLVGGGQPEIPARGLDDRTLFWTTILAHVVGTIILLVLVADATVLTWRFIGILKGGRTIYPRSTVERFAAELGPELQAVAAEPIAADVTARTSGGAAPLNSLLDDWIDARLLAQHTAAIGPSSSFLSSWWDCWSSPAASCSTIGRSVVPCWPASSASSCGRSPWRPCSTSAPRSHGGARSSGWRRTCCGFRARGTNTRRWPIASPP